MKLLDRIKNVIKNTFMTDKGIYRPDDEDIYLVCEDDLLLITIGQWMNLLPTHIDKVDNGIKILTLVSAQDIIDKGLLTNDKKNEILVKFSRVIYNAGFCIEDFCILDKFDSLENSFDANFYCIDKLVNFKLKFEDEKNFTTPELTVCEKYSKRKYDLYKSQDSNLPCVLVQHMNSSLVDEMSNKTLNQYYNDYSYYITLADFRNVLKLEIEYPIDGNQTESIDEALMNAIISTINFPTTLTEVCSKITEALKCELSAYPSINVTLIKRDDKTGLESITDEAKFINGEFTKLTVTRGSNVISIDKFDSWSFENDDYTVSQDNEALNYQYKKVLEDGNYPSVIPILNDAEIQAEEIKGIAKTLFRKEK